jgi:site-specific DNA-methyltransferase (adenine-specific)
LQLNEAGRLRDLGAGQFTRITRSLSRKFPRTFKSMRGALYHADCLQVLASIPTGTVAAVFADPPFNLNKVYGTAVDDSREDGVYREWSQKWLKEAWRILQPGGAIFLYHLPRWNVEFASFLLSLGADFRHWIAVDMPLTYPRKGRLHPSHYSLLYMTKGAPQVFNRIRVPVKLCRHCDKPIRDYGGYKSKLNPNGLTLKDVWDDIPPVRHRRYKDYARTANALSTKLVRRAIAMSTRTGDIVVDPFGGSGTTFSVCEDMGRRWIGVEIESNDHIVRRLSTNGIEGHPSSDYIEEPDNEGGAA